MTRYEIHFRGTIRKVMKAKGYSRVLRILETCQLTGQDKEDIHDIWWQRNTPTQY
jgi:hypothetical protein